MLCQELETTPFPTIVTARSGADPLREALSLRPDTNDIPRQTFIVCLSWQSTSGISSVPLREENTEKGDIVTDIIRGASQLLLMLCLPQSPIQITQNMLPTLPKGEHHLLLQNRPIITTSKPQRTLCMMVASTPRCISPLMDLLLNYTTLPSLVSITICKTPNKSSLKRFLALSPN